MAGLIPQSFVNGLIERVDIVEVVGGRVQLKKAGSNHVGLCPFHDEKTPSFHVYPDGQYHCFGCEAHGTTLGFLMAIDNLPFPEAVESLAATLGLEVPREGGNERRADPRIYDVLTAANNRFQDWLRHHAERAKAVDYLKARGLTGAVARDFGIGFAPPGWQALKTALGTFGESPLLDAGLLAKNDGGSTYDRFRDRIMFPIRDTQGRVIGFGGRVFGANTDGQPKYLNSPETEVFHKGRELYGLFEARRTPRSLEHIVVVEGYMDVVALAQHGVTNAVATLGTAIGDAHFRKLFRYVKHVVCCFDGDDAGRNAAWKAVDAAFPALTAECHVSFVFLPQGEDPDTIIRNQGSEHFTELVRAATPIGAYFLGQLQVGLDLTNLDARATLCELALPRLGRLPDGELRTILLRDLAALTENDVRHLEGRLQDAPVVSNRPKPATPTEMARTRALLRLLVREPQSFGCLSPADRSQLISLADGTLGAVVRFLAETKNPDAAALLGRFVGEPAHAELTAIAASERLPGTASESEFRECTRLYIAEGNRRALLEGQVDDLDDVRRYWDAKRVQTTARVDQAPAVPI